MIVYCLTVTGVRVGGAWAGLGSSVGSILQLCCPGLPEGAGLVVKAVRACSNVAQQTELLRVTHFVQKQDLINQQ